MLMLKHVFRQLVEDPDQAREFFLKFCDSTAAQRLGLRDDDFRLQLPRGYAEYVCRSLVDKSMRLRFEFLTGIEILFEGYRLTYVDSLQCSYLLLEVANPKDAGGYSPVLEWCKTGQGPWRKTTGAVPRPTNRKSVW